MADLFAQNILFAVPELIGVHGRIGGALIKKVRMPPRERKLSLSELHQRQLKGVLGEADDGYRIAFVDRPTNASIDADEVFIIDNASSVDACISSLSTGTAERLKPRPLNPARCEPEVLARTTKAVQAAWEGKFELREERVASDAITSAGLRSPQVGAVHASLAHWSVSNNPGTIVMPTGTGKTETMIALATAVVAPRLLIVVPNDALRTQISDKFLSLGILPTCGCLPEFIERPVVATLTRRPKSVEELDQIFHAANVVVTTMNVAGQATSAVQQRMAELASHLFVDEAHHIGAKTWRRFRSYFSEAKVLQFTATPFRRDKVRVDGRHIYVYPLWKAQQEGYFKRINYLPVSGADDIDTDEQIVDLVGQVLEEDRQNGFDHVVMARCARQARAEELIHLYRAKYPQHAPMVLHSGLSDAERKDAIERLRTRQSRIVLCVNMLGEGFDLPDLKIAALHDKHRSEAVTLQFIGRFTRARSDLGDATVIANVALGDINEPLKALYAEDADWNHLINNIGQSRTEREVRREAVFEGFTAAPERFPLETLSPRMSTVIYKTDGVVWQPELIEEVFPPTSIVEGPHINPHENLAIFVKRDLDQPKWTTSRAVHNTEYNLYMVHWDGERDLLFVHSSRLKDMHESLAKKLCGDGVSRVGGEEVYRCLNGVRRLCLNTLGLSETQRRPVRYSQFMGTDITEHIDTLPGNRNRSKTNLFGQGYTDEGKVTIGCSRKGKFWSYDATNNFGEWIDWCHDLGRKVLDDSIPTDAFLKNLIRPVRQKRMPSLTPVAIVWPERILDQDEERVELTVNGRRHPILNCDIGVGRFSDEGPVRILISIDDSSCEFEMTIEDGFAVYRQVDTVPISVSLGRRSLTIQEWFKEDPPHIYYGNGDMLVDSELFKLPDRESIEPFDPEKMIERDWGGVDIRVESQGKLKIENSIQRSMIDELISSGRFDVVFDDDGTGEAADIVCIKEDGDTIFVHLFHCKYSSEDTPGSRIGDLYEVCGQSQKSLRWRENPRVFFQHLRKREGDRLRKGGNSRYELGDASIVNNWLGRWSELTYRFEVSAVQPGYSKKLAKKDHMELLAATSSLLMETWSIPFELICSE